MSWILLFELRSFTELKYNFILSQIQVHFSAFWHWYFLFSRCILWQLRGSMRRIPSPREKRKTTERVPGKACCPWSSQNSPPSVKTGWGPSETMPISHSPQVPSQSPLTLSQSVDGRFTEWEICKLSLTPCVKLKIANYLYDFLVLCIGASFHFGSRCQVKDFKIYAL